MPNTHDKTRCKTSPSQNTGVHSARALKAARPPTTASDQPRGEGLEEEVVAVEVGGSQDLTYPAMEKQKSY